MNRCAFPKAVLGRAQRNERRGKNFLRKLFAARFMRPSLLASCLPAVFHHATESEYRESGAHRFVKPFSSSNCFSGIAAGADCALRQWRRRKIWPLPETCNAFGAVPVSSDKQAPLRSGANLPFRRWLGSPNTGRKPTLVGSGQGYDSKKRMGAHTPPRAWKARMENILRKFFVIGFRQTLLVRHPVPINRREPFTRPSRARGWLSSGPGFPGPGSAKRTVVGVLTLMAFDPQLGGNPSFWARLSHQQPYWISQNQSR